MIGKEFYRGAVAELVAPPVKPRIDGHLEALRRKDMVEPEGTYWIDEPVYRFHHVLDQRRRLPLAAQGGTRRAPRALRGLAAGEGGRARRRARGGDRLSPRAGALLPPRARSAGRARAASSAFTLPRAFIPPVAARSCARTSRPPRTCSPARSSATRGAEQEILWDLCEALLSAGDTARARGLRRALLGSRRRRSRASARGHRCWRHNSRTSAAQSSQRSTPRPSRGAAREPGGARRPPRRGEGVARRAPARMSALATWAPSRRRSTARSRPRAPPMTQAHHGGADRTPRARRCGDPRRWCARAGAASTSCGSCA